MIKFNFKKFLFEDIEKKADSRTIYHLNDGRNVVWDNGWKEFTGKEHSDDEVGEREGAQQGDCEPETPLTIEQMVNEIGRMEHEILVMNDLLEDNGLPELRIPIGRVPISVNDVKGTRSRFKEIKEIHSILENRCNDREIEIYTNDENKTKTEVNNFIKKVNSEGELKKSIEMYRRSKIKKVKAGNHDYFFDQYNQALKDGIAKFALQLNIQKHTIIDSIFNLRKKEGEKNPNDITFATGRGILNPTEIKKIIVKNPAKTMGVYIDFSASWSEAKIKQAVEALSVLDKYQKDVVVGGKNLGPLLKMYKKYLFDGEMQPAGWSPYENGYTSGSGATPYEPMIKEIQKDKPGNIMIITDDDFTTLGWLPKQPLNLDPDAEISDKEKERIANNSYVADGFVFIVYVDGVCPVLADYIHSKDPEKTMQFFIKTTKNNR